MLEGYYDWDRIALNFRESFYYRIPEEPFASPLFVVSGVVLPTAPSSPPLVPFPEELTRQDLEHAITVSPMGRIRPIGLTATTESAERIALRWEKGNVEDARIAGYSIVRRTGDAWTTVVANTGSRRKEYVDEGLTPATAYDYVVYTLTTDGVTSLPSDPASATTRRFRLFTVVAMAATVIAVLVIAGWVVRRARARI